MHRNAMATGPTSVRYGMASLPAAGSWPGNASATTPSPLERANSRSRPRPASHPAASSRFSAYVRVARSRYLRCSLDSAGIVHPFPLHDYLDRVPFGAVGGMAIEDLLLGVD